ncbi:MAG: BREX system Lon protease-like protein BrxL [Bacteroidota bacterium]
MPAIADIPLDALDEKLNALFPGRVVRKDILQQIKKGTNVPTFVLEFLLARYCASNDPDEIQAGIAAVFETLNTNYVRPDESNKAQSTVQQRGKHKFIDRVHVRYVEREKRHWAAMENFGSRRIAINPEFYRNNDRLLEGGIWAEVNLRYNEAEDDDYAFYVENLRPIQLSRFDFDRYQEGRDAFTTDEWMDVILRSVGLEPSRLTPRLKLHFLARLIPLVEPNYNFIELGPRGTGKSYFFSEFSPYATLVSGGQATKATLFYNNARGKVGLVGYWDTVAFDEVAGIKIKDADAVQIMKDFMANGRFSRGVEVIANASMAFVGNIDYAIDQLVNSPKHDLFVSLPKTLDLAVMDRFYAYLPGWEMPKSGSEYLTTQYGFITDYLAEAFHYMFKHVNRYDYVNQRVDLGPAVEGRDEKAIKKTISALLKILHPTGTPTDAEFEQYTHYAVELRRRVKEQMNKRKPDEEFANIDLSYRRATGEEVVVFCPESRNAAATLHPERASLILSPDPTSAPSDAPAPTPAPPEAAAEPRKREQHYKIGYEATGHGYETIFLPYAEGAKQVTVEDAYIRSKHQIINFVRFCEVMVKADTITAIHLRTGFQTDADRKETEYRLGHLQESLKDFDIALTLDFDKKLHDRQVCFDNGWVVKIGRGLDFYMKPSTYFEAGSHDLDLRYCQETTVDIFNPTESTTADE